MLPHVVGSVIHLIPEAVSLATMGLLEYRIIALIVSVIRARDFAALGAGQNYFECLLRDSELGLL